MSGSLNAQITPAPNGQYYITSENIREIAIIKAERDYYREIAINKRTSHIGVSVGVSTSKSGYVEASYQF